jgi:hypothetical protein
MQSAIFSPIDHNVRKLISLARKQQGVQIAQKKKISNCGYTKNTIRNLGPALLHSVISFTQKMISFFMQQESLYSFSIPIEADQFDKMKN